MTKLGDFTRAHPRSQTFTRDKLPGAGWGDYRKIALTKAQRVEGPFQCVTSEGNMAVCEDGYLAVGAAGFPYPVNRVEFERIYEKEVAPRTWEDKCDSCGLRRGIHEGPARPWRPDNPCDSFSEPTGLFADRVREDADKALDRCRDMASNRLTKEDAAYVAQAAVNVITLLLGRWKAVAK